MATSLLGWILGVAPWPSKIVALPSPPATYTVTQGGILGSYECTSYVMKSAITREIIVLSFSITEELAVRFITYFSLKAFQGKAREIIPAVWGLAGVFVLRFVLMAFKPET